MRTNILQEDASFHEHQFSGIEGALRGSHPIGAKESRGHYVFGSPPPGARVVCIDIESGPGVDIVADANDLHMVDDRSVDCVVCVGVLLHCRNPRKVIAEFHRILKPGGILYVAVAFISPHPGFPEVFYHFSMEGLTGRSRTNRGELDDRLCAFGVYDRRADSDRPQLRENGEASKPKSAPIATRHAHGVTDSSR